MSRFVHRKRQRSRQETNAGGGDGDASSAFDEPLRLKEAYLRMTFLYQSAHIERALHSRRPLCLLLTAAVAVLSSGVGRLT
jgi:hypothetical protein